MKNQEVVTKVTARIIEQLEQGVKPWECSWERTQSGPPMPRNLKTGRYYQGINVPLLWCSAEGGGYSTNWWLTYKQAQELGGQVRRGEKATPGVFYKTLVIEEEGEDDKGEERSRTIPMMRVFHVFNLDQIDGLERLKGNEAGNGKEFTPIPHAERILVASGADIREGGTRAFYAPGPDFVGLPDRWRFKSEADFYATGLHELVHWSGSQKRLNRVFGLRFGDQAYGFEELVAEMGSAFLCARIGLKGELQHANYVGSWLKILKEDAKALIKAASLAQKAFEYLYACVAEPDVGEDEAVAA